MVVVVDQTTFAFLTRLIVEFGIDEHHTLVLKPQELSQKAHVAIELLQKPSNFILLNLNYETFWTIGALSRYNQVILNCEENLNCVATIS